MGKNETAARNLLDAAYSTINADSGHAMDAEALFASLFFELGPEALTPQALDRLGRLYLEYCANFGVSPVMSDAKPDVGTGGDLPATPLSPVSVMMPLEVPDTTRHLGASDAQGRASVSALWSRIRDLVADAVRDATMQADGAAEAHAHYRERFTRFEAGVTWGKAFIGRFREPCRSAVQARSVGKQP
ncbi:hypothetical protein HLH26_08195 [Gluconacetobacter sp. 1b LMG 1731]|uniref:Uncharacterized protein n=2 Tax=Gluconacetobacter dulcium TaxID=2729096 RepID=A0A7W4IKE0_9PROT|nr:hypothetical protein [Gluconacetobacter dulcium]MBB2164521.1 hypothetical protein [Gluconacetobacter dulcium]MBB2193712.1 hypothetical protein [Gluconacetobacter dulcium]